jgi:hypothetical protein
MNILTQRWAANKFCCSRKEAKNAKVIKPLILFFASLARQLVLGVNLSKTTAIQTQRIRQLADRGNAEFFLLSFY